MDEELIAILGVGTAALGLMAAILQSLHKVHILVNSRMTEALSRIKQLEKALKEAGVVSPPKPKGDL